jgi:NAD(P)-dependent dehydrogenase (short-subunit alcohol dehydrogenase family)
MAQPYIDCARRLAARGVRAGDVADATAVQAMADAAVKQFDRIDILVNNAALRREKSFAELSYAEWREILDVTLDGAFHCTKACLPALRKSGAGTIVNIGGLSAHTGAKDRAHVVTAKAGLIGFTRALAHDLAADGITVNCVVPGLIGTPRPKDRPEPAHHLIHQIITGRAWQAGRCLPRQYDSCAVPVRGISTGRLSTPMAGPISVHNACVARRFAARSR